MSRRGTPASILALPLCLGLAVGCGDPSRPLEPPPGDGSMLVLLVLDPDTAVQPVLVESIEPERGWTDLGVELFLDGEPAAAASAPARPDDDELHPCILRYGTVRPESTPRCPTLDIAPGFGARWRLVVSAAGRPTASAEGVVPGDFRIVGVSARGDPPGTEGLEVHWTRSAGAWRYMVGVRPESVSGCAIGTNVEGCTRKWYAATADTVLRTVVPREALEGGEGAWSVDVYAVERSLYDHLTTGTAGDLFSVPPIQNVQGGYGVVGAWVRRTARATP